MTKASGITNMLYSMINLSYLFWVVILDKRGSDGGHTHPLGQVGNVRAVEVLLGGTKVNIIQQEAMEVKRQGGKGS